MIGAPNSLNLNCKVRVMKEAPGPSVSEEIADIFTNYNIDTHIYDICEFGVNPRCDTATEYMYASLQLKEQQQPYMIKIIDCKLMRHLVNNPNLQYS